MANLKAGTLIGGNMLWHAGNMPFNYTNGSLYLNGKKIYSELDKPTSSEVGALSLNGGSLNGELKFTYVQSGLGKFSLNMNNANIGGVNAIIFNDPSDVNNEGICFPKTGKSGTSTNVSDYDIIRALDDTLYFNTNKVYHQGFRPTPSEISAPYILPSENSGKYSDITTADFVKWLESKGAFTNRYWITRCHWSYSDNKTITDTGCGNIHLAGCTIEVISANSGAYTIRIMTPTTTSNGGTTMGEFIYVNNGSSYSPGWRRQYNTRYKPSAADVGALPIGGGTVTGRLTAAGFTSTTAGNAFSTAKTSDGSYASVSAESGFVMLWKRNDSSTIADEFIGIQSNQLRFRQDNGTGDKKYTDHYVYHSGKKPTPSEIGAVNKAGDTMSGQLIIRNGDINHRIVHSGTTAFYQGGTSVDGDNHNMAFSGYNGKNLTLLRVYMADQRSPIVRWGSDDHAMFHAGADVKMGLGRKIVMPTADYAAGATIEALPAGDGFGANLVISSGGNTVIGAGESATNLRNLTTGEHMYVTADGQIQLISGGNTWADRKTMIVAADGTVTINNAQTTARVYLGSSSTYLARSGDNLYVAANGGSGKVYIEGKANPIARVNGNDYEIFHTNNIIGKAIGASKALSTEDLDTLKTAGVYHQSANANALPERHYPVNLAGSLIVYLAAGIIQEYRVYNRAETWTRAQYSNGGWTTWAKTYNTLVKPSASELGVVPASDVNSTNGWSNIINKIPKITSSGVLEAAKYIDMREKDSTADYDIRLTATANYMSLTTQHGTIDIGAQSKDFAHIYTDRAEIYTNKIINVPGVKLRGSVTGDATINVSELQVKGNNVYHVGRKPTASDVGALPAVSSTYPITNSAGWHIIARVRMPQGASTVRIEIVGGNGFNVGQFDQNDIASIVLRSGNNNPKGINARIYGNHVNTAIIQNIAWKNVSGDDYDIYVNARTYGNAGLIYHAYCSPNATATFTNPAANLGTTKPDGLTDGQNVFMYSTVNKPTASDVGLSNVPNTVHTTSATANTVAVRDANADISCRLVRSSYGDESGISGGLAFRKSTSDNYIRFCNNTTSIRNWLGVQALADVRSNSMNNTQTTIPATESGDMNSQIAGYYGLYNGSKVANSPYSSYFYCETKSIYSTGALVQTAWPYDGAGGVFWRNYSMNSKSWSAWRELVSSGHSRFIGKGVGDDYHQGGVEVIGNGSADTAKPVIGFHQPGKYASSIGLFGAGDFRFHTQSIAGYANILVGNVNSNDVYIRSDIRLKTNLVKVDNALEKVAALTAYSYDKKQTFKSTEYDKHEVGLIAQDVEKVLPEAINRVVDTNDESKEEVLTISNSAINALLVEAIKELKDQNEMLIKRIEKLEKGKGE